MAHRLNRNNIALISTYYYGTIRYPKRAEHGIPRLCVGYRYQKQIYAGKGTTLDIPRLPVGYRCQYYHTTRGGAHNRGRNQHIIIAYGNNDSELARRPEEGCNNFVGFAIPPLTIYICLIFNFYQLSTPV